MFYFCGTHKKTEGYTHNWNFYQKERKKGKKKALIVHK